MGRPFPPTGVWLSALFFAAAGVLEVALALLDGARPLSFWPLWDALGRGLPHGLVAWGLWAGSRCAAPSPWSTAWRRW